MRSARLLLIAAGALVVAAAPVPAGTWAAATSPDGQFSVSTPCTVAEIAGMRALPAASLPVPLDPATRVLCRTDSSLFVAGVVAVPDLPAGATSLFDLISTRMRGDTGVEGTPSLRQIDGHRALLNRQQADGRMAQTGIVELDRLHAILLVSGVEPGSGVTVADQTAMIERFAASIRINQH